MLKEAGIFADIENKFKFMTFGLADLREAYPFIRIQVSRKFYTAARDLLVAGE